MKKKLVLLALLPLSAQALDCAQTPADLQAYKQTKSVNCQIKEIAQKINEQKNVVPKYLYHFGKKELLEQNIKAQTIPQEAWDDKIMGTKTRFHLQPNRRGLYGTAGIDTNNFGGDSYNWLMQIEIKEECQQPKNVVTFYDVARSKRFETWFESLDPEQKNGFKEAREVDNTCFSYGAEHVPYTGDFADSRCTQIMNNYIEKSNIKIVQDHVIKKAFYIRDRSCIKAIKGKPEELLEIALKNDLLWITPCDDKYSDGAGSFTLVLASALKEYPTELPLKTVDKLIEKAKVGGASEPLQAYRRCLVGQRMNEFRNSSNESWNYETLCQAKAKGS